MWLTWEEAEVAALDRSEWRRRVAKYVYGRGINQGPKDLDLDMPYIYELDLYSVL